MKKELMFLNLLLKKEQETTSEYIASVLKISSSNVFYYKNKFKDIKIRNKEFFISNADIQEITISFIKYIISEYFTNTSIKKFLDYFTQDELIQIDKIADEELQYFIKLFIAWKNNLTLLTTDKSIKILDIYKQDNQIYIKMLEKKDNKEKQYILPFEYLKKCEVAITKSIALDRVFQIPNNVKKMQILNINCRVLEQNGNLLTIEIDDYNRQKLIKNINI